VQEQSEQRRRIEEAAREIGERCAACWLRGGGEAAAHRTAECAWLREQLGEAYAAVRKRIRYEKGCFCCFLCGLSDIMPHSLSEGSPDRVVLPV
jgi:hypothetical protein